MNFHFPKDCDNAPKKRWIKEWLTELGKRNIDFIKQNFDKNYEFKIFGAAQSSIEQYIADFESLQSMYVEEIITHGKSAACMGTVQTSNKKFEFAIFFQFTSAGRSILKQLTIYQFEN